MDRPSTTERTRGSLHLRGILAVIALGWFLTLGTRFLIPVVVPQIKDTFAVSNATIGVAITVIWLGYGVMQFPAGILIDRFGVRTILGLSLALGGGSLGLIGVAPVFGVFLVACGLFGLATGLFGTSRGISLARFFQSNTGRAFGITLAAGSVGSAALPVVGAAVTNMLGWRLAIVLLVPGFIAMAVGVRVILPATPALDETADVSLQGFVDTLRGVYARRGMVAAFVGMTIIVFVFQALTAFLPLYLIEVKSLTQGTASGLFALFFLTGAGFHLFGGTASDRYGTRPVILAVAIVGAVTLALLPVVVGLVPLAILIVLLSSRMAAAAVLNPYIIDRIPGDMTATVWGLFRTLFFGLGATGSTVVGVLVDFDLFDESYFLLAGLTAVAFVLFTLIPKE